MPDSKNYFILFGLITIVITSLAFLNSRSSFFLKKQEEITNLQEKNADQEIINDNNNHQEEIINNPIILDNTIVNLIIFLFVLLIVLYFVYFSFLSPVVRNNSFDIIEDQTKKNNINESIFRRKILFEESENFFKKEIFYYFYDHDKLVKKGEEVKVENKPFEQRNFFKLTIDPSGKNNFKFTEKNFQLNNYHGEILKCKKKVKMGDYEDKDIRIIIKKAFFNQEKEKFFEKCFKHVLNEHDLDDESDPERDALEKFCNDSDASCEEYFDYFKGTLNFFNSSNIIAAFLSYGFFLFFFVIFYFVLYFLYTLIYCLFFLNEEELKEKENKILLAFYKTLRAIIFLNICSIYKIIPILVFLIILFYNCYLFFGKSIKFIPIIYNNAAGKFIKFPDEKSLGDLLTKGETEFPIIGNYRRFYGEKFNFPEKELFSNPDIIEIKTGETPINEIKN